MKKLLIIFLLSLVFLGAAYSNEKEVQLARDCIEKIKEIDPNRNILPYKFSKFSYYPLDKISGTLNSDLFDQDFNYCDWFDSMKGNGIYGSSLRCTYQSLDTIEIKINGANRFDENHQQVFVCAFRGCNYTLEGIRTETSGRDYSEKIKKRELKQKLNTEKKLNIGHIDVESPC